jgi:AP-3 complex subunit beta
MFLVLRFRCQDYIKDPDRKFVADTVAAIALCAQKLPSIATACLEGLLALVFYGNNFHL